MYSGCDGILSHAVSNAVPSALAGLDFGPRMDSRVPHGSSRNYPVILAARFLVRRKSCRSQFGSDMRASTSCPA